MLAKVQRNEQFTILQLKCVPTSKLHKIEKSSKTLLKTNHYGFRIVFEI